MVEYNRSRCRKTSGDGIQGQRRTPEVLRHRLRQSMTSFPFVSDLHRLNFSFAIACKRLVIKKCRRRKRKKKQGRLQQTG